MPLVVAVHGGAWRTGDRTLMRTIGEGLSARGAPVAAIAYRQRPEDPVADMVCDIRDAVAWARASATAAGGDARVVLLGDSAGAHAALLAALAHDGPAVDGVVALCGALDLGVLAAPVGAEQERRFAEYRATLAGTRSYADVLRRDDPVAMRRLRVAGQVPPLFAATSAGDFFGRSTLSYVATATALGDDVTTHVVGRAHPECRHSWYLDAGLAQTARLFDTVTSWLRTSTTRMPVPAG
jgi:acetyl esterase/lipase